MIQKTIKDLNKINDEEQKTEYYKYIYGLIDDIENDKILQSIYYI